MFGVFPDRLGISVQWGPGRGSGWWAGYVWRCWDPKGPSSPNESQRGSGSVRSWARLQIFFRTCGTRSKAFLILLSFTSGTENCVCKIVFPKSMLAASYKQGVETGENVSYAFHISKGEQIQVWKTTWKRFTKTLIPHTLGIREAHFDAQFNQMCQKYNDCILLFLPPWPHLLIGRSKVN